MYELLALNFSRAFNIQRFVYFPLPNTQPAAASFVSSVKFILYIYTYIFIHHSDETEPRKMVTRRIEIAFYYLLDMGILRIVTADITSFS